MRRRELLLLMAGAAGATVASFDVNGQHLSTYRVAYLALAAGEHAALMKPFVERLRERGLVQGQNLTVIYRSADGNAERLSQLADELVRTKPDVLVAGQGTLTALAAKRATQSIPVVFTIVGDPVGSGLVSSLARPGGNVTGMSAQVTEIGGKRLQLAQEIIPGAKTFAVLLNPTTPYSMLALQELQSAADAARLELKILRMTATSQLPGLLEVASEAQAAALIVLEDPLTYGKRREYETVGYVISGRAELTIEGQTIKLEPGDSWLVPAGAEHSYRIIETFTAVEATAPPAQVHGRDEG